MMASTVVLRRELGAEPYLVRPVWLMELCCCWDEEEEEEADEEGGRYMMMMMISILNQLICVRRLRQLDNWRRKMVFDDFN